MYEPPPGFKDIDGDAEFAPPLSDPHPIEVPGVGTLLAFRPRPRSLAAIAAAANHKLGSAEQNERLNQFIVEHIGDDETERIMLAMMESDLADDALASIARSIAMWGTARPYMAVVTLSMLTAHHWRTIRAKMMLAGIPDPMLLPSMHAVLDFTEHIILEGMNGGGNAKKADRERSQFWDQIYVPDRPRLEQGVEDTGHRPPPSGFDEDSVEDAFDIAAKFAAR